VVQVVQYIETAYKRCYISDHKRTTLFEKGGTLLVQVVRLTFALLWSILSVVLINEDVYEIGGLTR